METTTRYHLPVRPYSPIDALNRRAAAIGSPRYAQGAAHANYNGHHVQVYWNDCRQYYVCDYTWAGRIVLARGTVEQCTAAAIAEYNRGALGASVSVEVLEKDADKISKLFPQLISGPSVFAHESSWHTWRHKCAMEAARDSANPRCPVMLFDWDLMQVSESREAYVEALRKKHGRVYT